MEFTPLWLAYFFLNCLFSLNMEYFLSYVFFSEVFFKILVLGLCQPCQDSKPGWQPFWGDSDSATAVMSKGWGPVLHGALGDEQLEPEQLLCPHLCQPQLWADPLQTGLGGRGEKWRNLMTAQVCFWIEVQPWSFVFSATWPSGISGNSTQKVAWEWLPCLVVSSSAKWNKPNSSNALFLWASTKQLLLFSSHRVWYQVIKYDSASPTVSQPQYNVGHDVEVSLCRHHCCFRDVPKCLLLPKVSVADVG